MASVANSKLLNTGILNTKDACVVIVKTEWNAAIVDELERGCVKSLREQGVENIITLEVPGAFEIPFAIKEYWQYVKESFIAVHAFVALGAVIRGDTPHFDYVCKGITEGVGFLNLHLPVPTVFGVLTVDNEQQAQDRLGGPHGHKGEEAGITALKMISLVRDIYQKN